MPRPHRRHFLAAAGGLLLAARLRAAPADLITAPGVRRVVVVGGGWGGLAAAAQLRRLAPTLEVVLVEREAGFFSLPLSNAWLVGRRSDAAQRLDPAAAARALGYRRLQAEVGAIDRERRQVHTSAGRLDYDWLVLACGIRHDYRPWFGADPTAAAYCAERYPAGYLPAEMARLKALLAGFEGGDLLLNIPAPPVRCPPAAYERAAMIAWWLKTRRPPGQRPARLIVLDPGGGLLGFPRLFAERYREQITYVPHVNIRQVDLARRRVSTEVDDFDFQAAILAPPQQGGDLAWQAGLIGRDADGAASGWAEPHPTRLHAVADERVFLVGDLLGRVSPLFGQYTKSAHVAVRLGAIAATGIAAQAAGREPPPLLPDSVCHVTADLDPAEGLRIDASYRLRGDGLIQQTVKQSRDPQPRGEDEAWAAALRAELALPLALP